MEEPKGDGIVYGKERQQCTPLSSKRLVALAGELIKTRVHYALSS